MSEPQPGASRPDFRPSRRGYDRGEVDAFVTEALERIEAASRERDALDAQLATLGVKGAAELQVEIEAVSGEVRRILHAAREAAEGMRERARDDATRWQSEAEAQAVQLRSDAQSDAVRLRTDAWTTGVEMLEQALAEAESMVAAARHDTLLIRAEAEQDAHRLVSSARRDTEEEARATRLNSERLLAEAKAESERIVESARLEAEAAQERAGALENRRGELMQELEDARAAIAGLESDLTTRRESLRLDDDPAAATPSPALGGQGDAGEWRQEDASVRIVPLRKPRASEEVDADAMAAEVQRLHDAADDDDPAPEEPAPEPEVVGAAESPAVDTIPAPAAPAPPVAPPPEAASAASPEAAEPGQPESADSPDPDVGAVSEQMAAVVEQRIAPAIEQPPPPAADPPVVVPPPPVAQTAVAEEPEPTPPAEPVPAEPVPAEPDPATDPPLDDLFARLRGTPEVPAGNGAGPDRSVEPEAATEPVASPEPATSSEPTAVTQGADPFELRDRLLLPLTNHALRGVKRVILDLQNEALDELRTTGETWVPDPATYDEQFADDLDSLQSAARFAGAEAAGQLAGGVPEPAIGDGSPAPSALGSRLAAALDDIVSRAEGSGAGERSTAAAVSRVFRAWRSDEAERQVRNAAYAAYHRGLGDGLAALGVATVGGAASGFPCAECPAGHGATWDPAGLPPAGTGLPPIHADCVCTIVPG